MPAGHQLCIILLAGLAVVAGCGGTEPPATHPPAAETAIAQAESGPAPTRAVGVATAAVTPTGTAAASATPAATATTAPTMTPPPAATTAPPTPTPMETALLPLTGSGGGIIAFVSGPVSSAGAQGTMEIYLMNADGSGQRPVTDNRVDDICPAWSPDGDRIAFISDPDGNWDLFVLNVEAALRGGGFAEPQRLTTTPADEYGPSWSPDGTEIAFSASRGGSWGVWALNAEKAVRGTATGGGAWQLAEAAGPQSRVDWSPTGEKIAFVSIRDGNREIYVMNADGSQLQRLTENENPDFDPAWSPEGTQLAYTSRVDTSYDVFVMDAGGENQRRLTQGDADEWWPAWSPDGRQIAFSSNGNDDYWHDIYVMSAAGTGQRRLTAGTADEWFPGWRP